jgi:kumamolisin
MGTGRVHRWWRSRDRQGQGTRDAGDGREKTLRRGRLALAAGVPVGGLAVLGALAIAAPAQPGLKPLEGNTPAVVSHGHATLHGAHNRNSTLTLNVGLDVRNSAALDSLIKAASTPGNPGYGHYLTNAQYMAGYAPTGEEVSEAVKWLRHEHLDVTGVSPDNLLIHTRGRTATVERAFGVSINDYQAHGRTFHANDTNPTVPAYLHINYIGGLSNADVYKPLITCTPEPGSKCGYDGGDFRAAYDVVGDGTGQTLGFTLWGRELPQSDFNGYAEGTGNTAITIGKAGDDGLNYIQVDGSSSISNTDTEVALDTQIAHGVAPGLHETYWLGKNNENSTLEDVLNEAANSSIKVISNSWGAQENPCNVDSNMESALQHGASTGKTFYFATGDSGASAGCSYPAVSQYVVAVGGTALEVGAGSSWKAEEAIENGGGCLGSEPRPSWQTGIGTAFTWGSPPTECSGRAEPDVSANSGFGVYLFVDGSAGCCTGGTSLATPIWSAGSVIWNKHNGETGRPGIGFAAPLIYSLANNPNDYPRDFHDITTGSNGFAAVTGWDEATGWGSPDFNKLSNNEADIAYTGPTTADHGETITLSATLTDHGKSTGLSGRKISFAAAGETCEATTEASGNASCNVKVEDAPGHYSVIAVFAGDAGYKAVSTTKPFTVLHIPTTVTYTGATSGEYNDAVTLSAKLTENSDGKGLAGEPLHFSLGIESCEAITKEDGTAECEVTPLDEPGSYTVGVSFAGDEPTYEGSSTSAGFTLEKEESKLTYNGALTTHYHDAVKVSATLIDPEGGAPIAHKPIVFRLGVSDMCTAMTDESGNASCMITPHTTGTQPLEASFAGDADYLSSSDPRLFSVTPEETTMTYTGPTVILAGAGGATLSAKMVEDGTADNDGDGGSPGPVPSEPVTLALGTQMCTAFTEPSGEVSCTIPSVTVPLGPEVVSATFAGDGFYAHSAASKNAIVFAFPSRGAFTLGDKTVAAASEETTVSWWADTWSSLNSLSGGPAPPAGKGFAGTVSLPSTTPPVSCSSGWSTSGGNSPPPVASIPSYMGTLVTSAVTKSGSVISGNTVEIVVVKTNPGYAPNPASHGTGVIVAKYC